MRFEVNKNNTITWAIATALKDEIKEPSQYKVIVHNDDYTPMEFVVMTVEKFFYLGRRKATDIMLEAHLKGKAVVGIYTKDIAETKISQLIHYARSYEHPLICSMEAA